MTATLALPGTPAALTARLHPLVLFNVCDSYIRRNENQERVIGTLLGSVSDGVVEIRNSYAVPHNEANGQVALDIEYHRNMLDLHLRVSPKDVLVGWYSTGGGAGITDTDALIHDFFGRECAAPVHLAVDTGFVEEARAIRAWVGSAVALGDAVVGTSFVEVSLEHALGDAERAGLPSLALAGDADGAPQPLPNDLAGLEASVQRLAALLELAATYAEAVCDGRLPPNNTVGRFLADTCAAVPRLSRDAFDKLFNDSVQDVLLVMYLSNLTRTQLALAERLNTPVML